MKTKPTLSMHKPSARPAGEGSTAARQARALAEGAIRLSLDLPLAAHRALKIAAADQHKTMRELVLDLIRGGGVTW